MINATVVGNLGRDAETKGVAGKKVIEFSIASTKKTKNGDSTTWVRCSYWSTTAGVAPYLVKGAQVAVAGTLSLREFTKKDGEKGSSLDMDVRELQLVGGKKEAAGNGAAAQAHGLDDIPF